MKVLHGLEHSLPVHGWYAFCSTSILAQQQALGLEVAAVNSPKQRKAGDATVNGVRYFRRPSVSRLLARLPVLAQLEFLPGRFRRLDELTSHKQPDLLHSCPLCLHGLASWWVSHRCELPFVNELRASRTGASL
jgi:hypothetical protein